MWEVILLGRNFKIHWRIAEHYEVVAANDPSVVIYNMDYSPFGEINKGLGIMGCVEVLERAFFRYVWLRSEINEELVDIAQYEIYKAKHGILWALTDGELVQRYEELSERYETKLPIAVETMGTLLRKLNLAEAELIKRGFSEDGQ